MGREGKREGEKGGGKGLKRGKREGDFGDYKHKEGERGKRGLLEISAQGLRRFNGWSFRASRFMILGKGIQLF